MQLHQINNFQQTKETLHGYAKAVAMIPRALAESHPLWWHASLKITTYGFRTDNINLNDGRLLSLLINFKVHQIHVLLDGNIVHHFQINGKLSRKELGNSLIEFVSTKFGIEKTLFDLSQLEGKDSSIYNRESATSMFNIFSAIEKVFAKHMDTIEGNKGQIQLWPHNFDIAVEWYLRKNMISGEELQATVNPAQVNLGFIFGDDTYPNPYFYSNPWPFNQEKYLQNELPNGAMWVDFGWQGSCLPYESLINDDAWEEKLLHYLRKIFELAIEAFLLAA